MIRKKRMPVTLAVATAASVAAVGGLYLTDDGTHTDVSNTDVTPGPPASSSPAPSEKPSKKPTPSATKPPATERPAGAAPMSSFTVRYPPDPARTTNVQRAAALINGTVVAPGKVWSMNGDIGERTKANGFVEGVMIDNGRYERDYGGGISALATTVYNAAFFAGLEDVAHTPHSFYIERYPEGREATVAWGSIDLKWRNDTAKPVTIRASATPSAVTVSLLGERRYDSVTSRTGPRTAIKPPAAREGDPDGCVPQAPLEGFHVEVTRLLTGGGKTESETHGTTYDPRDRITCTPTPKGTP